MATDPGIAAFELAPVYTELVDYWVLTKPDINFLIAVATLTGFYLGCPTQLHGFPYTRGYFHPRGGGQREAQAFVPPRRDR